MKLLRNSVLVEGKFGLFPRLGLIPFSLRLGHEWEPSTWNLVKAAIVIDPKILTNCDGAWDQIK